MSYELTVYYDGLCHLCSREIEFYQKHQYGDKIQWIDISSSTFDANAAGLDSNALNFYLHARLPSGEVLQGVDSFIEIWKVLKVSPLIIGFVEAVWVKPFLKAGYHAFALLRPYLPKKKREECESDQCDLSLGEKIEARNRALKQKHHQTAETHPQSNAQSKDEGEDQVKGDFPNPSHETLRRKS